MRKITRKRKFDEIRSTKRKYLFYLIYELQTYEVLEILTKVLRKEHTSKDVNSFITTKEKSKQLLSDTQIRTLQMRSVMNKFNKKKISERVKTSFQ